MEFSFLFRRRYCRARSRMAADKYTFGHKAPKVGVLGHALRRFIRCRFAPRIKRTSGHSPAHVLQAIEAELLA